MQVFKAFEGIFDLLDEIVIVINDQEEVIYFNRQGKEFLGIVNDAATGTIICVPEAVREKLIDHKNTRHQSNNGETIASIRRATYAIRSSAERVDGENVIVFVFRNISKEKNAVANQRESESLFRAVFENAPGGIVMLTPDGRIMAANKYFCSFIDYDIQDLIDIPYVNVISASDEPLFLQKMGSLLAGTLKNNEYEKKIIHKNQSHVSFLSTLSLVRGENNEPLYVIEQLTNITQRKSAEKALRASERKFNNFFHSTPVSHLIVSAKHNKVLECNTTFSQVSGYSDEELIDKRFFDLFDAGDVRILEGALSVVSNSSNSREFEAKIIIKSGALIPVSVKISPIFDKAHNHISNIVACTDISSQVKIRQELIKEKEKAEQSDKLKTSFLANLSHEIRTPLNGIIGFTDLLAMNIEMTEKTHKYISIIKQRSADLLRVIEAILDISKLEAGILQINDEIFELPMLISDIEKATQNRLQFEKKTNLTFEVNESLTGQNVFVKSDKVRISQILHILIDNAIKFTERGLIQVGGHFTNKKELILWVSDTGIGIPRDKHKVVFERFRQVNEHYARRYNGNGLGLAIAKGILARMKGKIWLESVPDRGSIFYIKIPIAVVNFPHESIEQVVNERKKWNGKVALLVEDDDVSAELVSEMLSDTGINIIHTRYAKSAKEIIENNNDIDIVLMDISLPDENGVSVTKFIKNRSDVPVIAQTAFAMEDERKAFLDEGCNDYLTKPIDKTVLLGKMGRFLD